MFSYLGCSLDHVSECFDKSDLIECSMAECQISHKVFTCSDKKYCIPKYLVCDGYAQCEDESGIFISRLFQSYEFTFRMASVFNEK